MKEYRGVGFGSGLVRGRVELAGEGQRHEGTGGAVIVGFLVVPSVGELLRSVRAPESTGVMLPVCSPYSHLAWAISYAGVPALFVEAAASIRPGELAYLDADRGLVLYPDSGEEEQRLEEDRTKCEADARRTASRALLPAVSRSGVAVRVLAQIQSAEDVTVARDCGAEGVGEIKSELLLDAKGSAGAAAYLVDTIRAETQWKDIPIRFFDFESEKPDRACGVGFHDGPMGVRGVRLLEKHESLMARFLEMLEGVELDGIVVVLPMVTLPVEVERFRERLIGQPLKVGVLIETPAAAVNIDKFLDVSDYFEIGVNDLTQFTMAWDRVRAHHELLPVDKLADPVERLVSGVARAVSAKQGFASLAVDLPPSTQLVRQVLSMGIEAIAVPPRLIPLWKERIRLGE